MREAAEIRRVEPEPLVVAEADEEGARGRNDGEEEGKEEEKEEDEEEEEEG